MRRRKTLCAGMFLLVTFVLAVMAFINLKNVANERDAHKRASEFAWTDHEVRELMAGIHSQDIAVVLSSTATVLRDMEYKTYRARTMDFSNKKKNQGAALQVQETTDKIDEILASHNYRRPELHLMLHVALVALRDGANDIDEFPSTSQILDPACLFYSKLFISVEECPLKSLVKQTMDFYSEQLTQDEINTVYRELRENPISTEDLTLLVAYLYTNTNW